MASDFVATVEQLIDDVIAEVAEPDRDPLRGTARGRDRHAMSPGGTCQRRVSAGS